VQSDCGKQDRSLDSLVGIEQIPPRLAVAFESTTSVNMDVLAAEQEEAPRILEVELESVFLPVIRIVGECDTSLYVYVYMR